MTCMSTSTPTSPSGATTVDLARRSRRIRFIEVLGKGGFGAVYLADVISDDDFVQRVAIKILSADMSAIADFAARQRDEARLLGRMVHDNIVRVFDMTELDGRPAVIMEYVEGIDMAQLLSRGPLPPRAAFQIVAHVAGALQAARLTPDPHTGAPLHVVHRDIKPANILLSRHGGVKVLDFGIAKASFDREGQTGSVQFGTTRYMAPEQWLYSAVSHKVDIFALGVSFAEALAGRPITRAPLQPESFQTHIDAVVKTITADRWTDAVRADVAGLLHSMLAFNPDDRPDAGAVADACLRLADTIPGESATRYARRVVPDLVERRRERFRTMPLPQSMSVEQPSLEVGPSAALPDSAVDISDQDVLSSASAPGALPAEGPVPEPGNEATLVRPLDDPPPASRRWLPMPIIAVSALLVVVFAWLAGNYRTPTAGGPRIIAPASRDVPTVLAADPSPVPPLTVAAPTGSAGTEPHPPETAPKPSPARPSPSASVERTPAPDATETQAPAAPAPDAPQPEAAPPPAPPAASGPPLPITLTSTPYGATVTLDGRTLAGQTPLRDVVVAGGRHQLRIEGPGGSCTGTIRVSAARTNTFLCTLADGKISARQ